MDFYNLLEITQLRAIQAALQPSAESVWRMRCRAYSEKFFTPLHVVMHELDPAFVLQALYEERYTPSEVQEDLEGILETLYRIKDPNYNAVTQQETEDLVDNVLNKEIARLAKKKRPTQETIQQDIKSAKPKSGSMNFQDLEKMESLVESNKSGFDK